MIEVENFEKVFKDAPKNYYKDLDEANEVIAKHWKLLLSYYWSSQKRNEVINKMQQSGTNCTQCKDGFRGVIDQFEVLTDNVINSEQAFRGLYNSFKQTQKSLNIHISILENKINNLHDKIINLEKKKASK
jgi:hypothetical protein